MDAIWIFGMAVGVITVVLMAWTIRNSSKAETENDALTRAVLRLYDKQRALEKEVLELRTELIQLQTNDQVVTKKAPPRPVPPKKYVSENDSFDIPTVAATATAAALGATALGAWAMPSSSSSSYSSDSSWDCGDSFDCGGE